MNQQRQLSIDVFRGMTVALIIVVNSLGSPNTYSPLLHADWNGFTLTDFVFPTFLFVVGNAMSFTQGKYEQRGEAAFFAKVLKRTLIIFLIGYLLSWFPFIKPFSAPTRITSYIRTNKCFGWGCLPAASCSCSSFQISVATKRWGFLGSS